MLVMVTVLALLSARLAGDSRPPQARARSEFQNRRNVWGWSESSNRYDEAVRGVTAKS
jgi:hypothetical protein